MQKMESDARRWVARLLAKRPSLPLVCRISKPNQSPGWHRDPPDADGDLIATVVLECGEEGAGAECCVGNVIG